MIFCQDCASRPGWPFDATQAVRRQCQRCFLFRPCFDYTEMKGKKKAVPMVVGPAMESRQGINDNAQTSLPPVAPRVVAPIPVTVVEQGPDLRNETDKLLDSLQPNRPMIKLETVKKGGANTKKA